MLEKGVEIWIQGGILQCTVACMYTYIFLLDKIDWPQAFENCPAAETEVMETFKEEKEVPF